MGFTRWVVALAFTAALLICSCEKHRVGEYPEVQKEHVDLAKGGEETAPAADESKASSRHASPTPADFFPSPTPIPTATPE